MSVVMCSVVGIVIGVDMIGGDSGVVLVVCVNVVFVVIGCGCDVVFGVCVVDCVCVGVSDVINGGCWCYVSLWYVGYR